MFDDPKHYLWLIPFLPFLGAAVIALLGKPLLRGLSHWPCILGAAGACVLSVMALLKVHHGETTLVDNRIWFEAGNVQVAFALRLDALAAVMLVTVTFIGTLIAIYSSGYMHGDPGYPRFFAAVSLFLASMTGLVLASNFILLYACWEGVGLCSYLLIGFWYARPSAAAAARKAFLVTRLGDIGLFLGILILWNTYHTLNFYTDSANPDAPGLFSLVNASDPLLGWACLLLFIGAVGKSAQFPLHVWLPDAMEGPSPVSALIHAATMVTAGVYLVARCTPLFQLVPDVQAYIACTGGFTALLAALIALTQTDLKRVLAYSTVSQLGFMFLALGAALQTSDPERTLAPFAVTAAIFHLFTHAFFKALLFLGAGSVMHAMGDVIDMRKFSGLRRVLPTTHWTFLIGSLALAGVVPLAGFWSKDEILAVVRSACDERFPYRHLYSVLFLGAIITAGMTAFYTFRAYFMTFWGVEKIPQEAYMHHGHGHDEHAHGHDHGHHHGHSHGPESGHGSGAHDPAKKHFESGEIMLWPLRILAAGAVLVGVVLGPTGLFAHFLEDHWMKAPEGILPAGTKLIHAHNYPVMIGSTLFALGGIALAYFAYVKRPSLAQDFQNSAKRMYYWSLNKFYLDELFSFLFVQPCLWLAKAARVIDQYVVDGLVDLVGQLPAYLATLTRPVQNGLVQFYALLMALGIAGFLLAVLLR